MIKNGELANSEEMMSLTGQLFANICPLYWQASYTPTTHVFGNRILDNAQVGAILPTVTITANSFVQIGGSYLSGVIYDVYNSSVDAAKWETDSGSLVEDTVQINGTVTAPKSASTTIIVNAKGLNLKPASNKTINLAVNWKGGYATNSGSSSGSQTLELWDGSHAVTVATYSQTSDGGSLTITNANTEILLVNTGGTIVCTAGTETNTLSVIDVSTLSGSTWTVRVKSLCDNASVGTDGSVTAGFGFYYYSDEATAIASTAELVSVLTATTSTITDALLVLMNNFSTTGATVTTSISSDGTNYVTSTINSVTDFVNTGTSPKIKVTVSGTPTKLIKLKEFGIIYNIRQ